MFVKRQEIAGVTDVVSSAFQSMLRAAELNKAFHWLRLVQFNAIESS